MSLWALKKKSLSCAQFIINTWLFVSCLLQIRRQAIKELPRFAAGENLPRVADILTQLLQTGICAT